MSDMKRVCGLWKNDKGQKVFYKGQVKMEDLKQIVREVMSAEMIDVFIFPNERDNEHPKAPHISLCFAESKPKEKPAKSSNDLF